MKQGCWYSGCFILDLTIKPLPLVLFYRGVLFYISQDRVTALRNLRAAPADAERHNRRAPPKYLGAAEQTPQRDGAARPVPGNGNKRQRPNPRPDLKRGREADERATNRGTGPIHTELNMRNRRRLEALSRRYP